MSTESPSRPTVTRTVWPPGFKETRPLMNAWSYCVVLGARICARVVAEDNGLVWSSVPRIASRVRLENSGKTVIAIAPGMSTSSTELKKSKDQDPLLRPGAGCVANSSLGSAMPPLDHWENSRGKCLVKRTHDGRRLNYGNRDMSRVHGILL